MNREQTHNTRVNSIYQQNDYKCDKAYKYDEIEMLGIPLSSSLR